MYTDCGDTDPRLYPLHIRVERRFARARDRPADTVSQAGRRVCQRASRRKTARYHGAFRLIVGGAGHGPTARFPGRARGARKGMTIVGDMSPTARFSYTA